MSDEVSQLRRRIADLESLVDSQNVERQTGRSKISVMSSEVKDDNPYSRLMALKRMGIVDNYEAIRHVKHSATTFAL